MSTPEPDIWFESLPDQCPPDGAKPPNGVFFRLSKTEKAVCEDFWSARKLQPNAIFNASECIAMAVSVYSDRASLTDLQKLTRHKEKAVVAVKLVGEAAGRIQKTGQNKHHHSWWRAAEFPVLEHLSSTVK